MKKDGWIILGVVAALALLLGGIWWGYSGQGYYGPWGMMGGRGMMGGWWGGLGMLLFWALVIGGIVWLVVAVSRSQQSGTPRPAGETPLDILKRRYAAGETSKEQFDEMKRNLES